MASCDAPWLPEGDQKDFKIFQQCLSGMQLLDEYAAVLIVSGQVLAVVGILLFIYIALRQRIEERVEVAERPERHGLPYPDLYYWHVIRQRSSIGEKIRQVFRKGRSEGM